MYNVCCVYWGSKYAVKYVNKLHNAVQRHLTLPHKFICFTDHNGGFNEGIETRPFPMTGFKGWWNKLLLFHPDTKLEGRNLFFDLDVILLDNINDFLTYGEENTFSIIRDFGRPETEFNSSIMSSNNKYHSEVIWNEYLTNKVKYDKMSGDQNVITSIMFEKKNTDILKPFPNEWSFSYKWPVRGAYQHYKRDKEYHRVPGASVCVCHGSPRPAEIETKWVVDNWR